MRFDLKGLFLLTAVCAVAVALVRALDLVGTVVIFIIAVIASGVIFHKCSRPTRRFWFQAIWGMLLPLACLATDPVLFRHPMPNFHAAGGFLWSPLAVGCYAFIAWQMAMLACSWFLPSSVPRVAALMAGNLLCGAVFAFVVGMILFPLTIVAMWTLIGLPGWTPWMTMLVYGDASRYCWKVTTCGVEDRRWSAWWGLVGFAAALAVASAAGGAWDLFGSQ